MKNYHLVIVILVFVGISIFTISKNVNLNNVNETQKKSIEALKNKNAELEKKVAGYDDLIARYQKNNKELALENSQLKREAYVRPKAKRKTTATNTKRKTYSKKTTSTKKTSKKYQKFSKYIKLTSASTIKIRSDNRLRSKSTIYGSIATSRMSKINCNLKQNIPKIVDECSMEIQYGNDKVFLKRSNVISVQRFDTKTEKVECKYSQTHGIMHDCKVVSKKRAKR